MPRETVTIDGNEAVASVAYRCNEVIAIYPITPSSPMGEHSDEWSSWEEPNIWGTVPLVVEMQSEAGAAGAIHGALQTGSLTTTFTSSQGLLLMIPEMFKIAGELNSAVFHIAARTVATHALSIFGDHSDVMAARNTGWGMLFGNTPQEAMDLALIAQAATLESRVPIMNIMDGFRTSHEVRKIERLADEDLRAMLDDRYIQAHRQRALAPEHPFLRGTAQNPDVFFQNREAANPYYLATPAIVQAAMDRFAEMVGRRYHLFDYVGAPDAERVLVLMGSGCEAAEETVEHLTAQGEKVGMLKVRLFRPFDGEAFLHALPPSVRAIAVLDRTKEPGALGEPLYQDVVTALHEALAEGTLPCEGPVRVVGGRYGLSSKEFTPAMVKAVLDEMVTGQPRNHFTVGIQDDVTGASLPFDPTFSTEPEDLLRAVFWGLGSDGTVGANKNSIKIIGEHTPYHAQGYFEYDSKKSGARTISHLRFGPRPIHGTYLIQQAGFLGVHQFGFLERFRILERAMQGATLLLNAPHAPEDIWDRIPRPVQEQIIARGVQVWAINAYGVAQAHGLGNRINTIMQTCFFALSKLLPIDEAIAAIKQAIQETYGKRGEAVVRQNHAVVDAALNYLFQVSVPERATGDIDIPPAVPDEAPDFVREVTAAMMAGEGDELPVSALPLDGAFPKGTTRWDKRNIALEVPVWLPHVCIQCGRCVMYCPHAVIRSKVYDEAELAHAPEIFQSIEARWREPELQGKRFTVQVAVEDCTGCAVCVAVCPAKDKTAVGRKAINMEPQLPRRETERENLRFFLSLPKEPPASLRYNTTKNVQLRQPLFEFHTACAGCGETPYLRLLSQLFGDRIYIANATGCTSIYGGNLPTHPWAVNDAGLGPAWSNSLFEDNAEFALGMRLTLDRQGAYARELLGRLGRVVGADLAAGLLEADQSTEEGIAAQRQQVARLRKALKGRHEPEALHLANLADMLVQRDVWAIGGDGWAYDIGYGGLDHVLATGRNVNALVVDTEVYSNTGGQASKSTDLGAVAKFAAGGKPTPKKDLGMMVMTYGYVYVAQVAMGASDAQTIRAFLEAASYPGPSLIIAYSTCIAHGINMALGMQQEKLAVDSGHWILYRYDPRLRDQGKNPLQLDSKAPSVPLRDYYYNENRYRMLAQSNPAAAERLLSQAQAAALERWQKYAWLAQMEIDLGADAGEAPSGPKEQDRGPEH
ncbi:MAG: pyruvate:ferredoxin (flavodoxin) oxidoreductase [Anaerolineae bacterium]